MQPTTRQMVKGLDNLSKTILNKARMNAPVLTGALRASGNISNTGMYSRVIGFSVPYATVREFNNKKHPNTKFYLRRATVSTLTASLRRTKYVWSLFLFPPARIRLWNC